MSFTTLHTGLESRFLTEEVPGAALVKSPYEQCVPGPAGKPDELTIYWEGVVDDIDLVNINLWNANPPALDTMLIGTDISGFVDTAGTWIAVGRSLDSDPEDLPFVRYAATAKGLLTSKNSAVRWSGVTEQQNGEDVTIDGTDYARARIDQGGLAVEIDEVVLGSAPNMAQVGTEITPPDAPTPPPNAWDLIADPLFHWPNGWVLKDLRTESIGGNLNAWLVTWVYHYQHEFTP